MVKPDLLRKGAGISLLVLWASFAFSSALSEISFVAALVFWAIWKIRAKAWDLRIQKPVLILLSVFMAWCTLTYFWSDAPPQSFRGIFKIAQQIMIFVMAADTFRESTDFSKWEKVFCAMLILVLADALFQGLTGRDFLRHIAAQDSGAGIRISASFKTYGLLGCYLVVTLPIFLMMTLKVYRAVWNPFAENGSRLSKIMFPWLLLAGCAVLFFTKSRGALLSFAVAIFFLILYSKKWRILIVAALLALGAFAVLPRSVIIHLDADGKEQSLVERYYLWDRAVSVIKAKPLTGTGINTYAAAHPRYDTTKSWRVRNYYAHNGYLQLAAETGLPGLILFLSFLSLQLAWSFARVRTSFVPLGLLSAVTGFLIFSLIDTVLHNEQPAMAFWYLLGLLSAYLSCPKASETA